MLMQDKFGYGQNPFVNTTTAKQKFIKIYFPKLVWRGVVVSELGKQPSDPGLILRNIILIAAKVLLSSFYFG